VESPTDISYPEGPSPSHPPPQKGTPSNRQKEGGGDRITEETAKHLLVIFNHAERNRRKAFVINLQSTTCISKSAASHHPLPQFISQNEKDGKSWIVVVLLLVLVTMAITLSNDTIWRMDATIYKDKTLADE